MRRLGSGGRGCPAPVGFEGDGGHGLAADENGLLRVWDLSHDRVDAVLDAQLGAFGTVALYDHGRSLLAINGDSPLSVWNLSERRVTRSIELPGGPRVTALATAPDDRLAAAGNEQARVCVVELATGREVCRFQSPDASTGALAFTPDGKTLLLGLIGRRGGPQPVEVHDAATGRLVHRMLGHTEPVWSVACLPDGRRAVSASGDGTLRVWELSTGRALASLGKHPGAARCLAIAPDGHTAIVGTGHRWANGWRPADSYGVQLWDLDTGRNLGRFSSDSAVTAVAVSPDGRRALAADESRVLHSWDMPTAPTTASATLATEHPNTPVDPMATSDSGTPKGSSCDPESPTLQPLPGGGKHTAFSAP